MMAFPAATTGPTTTFSFHLTSPGKPKPQPPKLTSSSLLAEPSSIRLSCARSIDVSKEDSPTQQQEQPPQQLPEENSLPRPSTSGGWKRSLPSSTWGYTSAGPDDWRCPTCSVVKIFFESKSVEIAEFSQNQQFGFGTNTLTSGQKAILIYGSLLLFFILFLSGYFLQ